METNLKCTAVTEELDNENNPTGRIVVAFDWNTEHYEHIFANHDEMSYMAGDLVTDIHSAAKAIVSYWKTLNPAMDNTANIVDLQLRVDPTMPAIALSLSSPIRRLVWAKPLIGA